MNALFEHLKPHYPTVSHAPATFNFDLNLNSHSSPPSSPLSPTPLPIHVPTSPTQRPLPYFSTLEYALWPRDEEELYDEARQNFIDKIDSKAELIQFIESELSKEDPLVLPEPFSGPELDQLHSNFKDTTMSIARCSQVFCPDIVSQYDRALRLALELDSETHMYTYRKCRFDRILTMLNPNTCREPLAEVLELLTPRVLKAVEKETIVLYGEKLQNYIGAEYRAPFWFSGAGDVWRRKQHGSNLVDNENPCGLLDSDMEKCMTDTTKSDEDCYYQYTQSKICKQGLNCRYLRVPMLNCLAANGFTNYTGVTQCLEMLPNFTSCELQFTPPPKSIHVDVTDMIDRYELPRYHKAIEELTLKGRREKYDVSMSQLADRAREIANVDDQETDHDWSETELAFLLKNKDLSFQECTKRLAELDIKHEKPNPYDKYMFSDEVALQPSMVDEEHQAANFQAQVKLFEQFAKEVSESREGLTERVQDQLKTLNWIREETKKRQMHRGDYPDLKNVLFFDNYYKMYFSYQPILNTSYPVFPISHLYHYQDFDYDWVDPNGTLSSVPFLRIDNVGENFSPSFFAKSLVKDHPQERLEACRGDTDCDNSNKALGTYLGFPQLDNMSFLNHYRMYFKDRDMYMTCYANDTTCIPSRFPDDNYGTFRDGNGHNWFYRPDRFEYYCYTKEGDRIVYSVADKTTLRWTMRGQIEKVSEEESRAVQDIMKKQSEVWELEAIDIVKHRTRKETLLKGHVAHGGSLLNEHLGNTQFDERIPYAFHPFAKYSQNLDAYRYYLALKQQEDIANDKSLASDPAREVRERLRYRYRRSMDFFNPVMTLEDDDANRLRDALILSFHELKLLRHPLGAIVMREMPPRVADRFDADLDKRPALFNYLQLLKLDPHSAVMFDVAEDSALVAAYMKRHGLTSFEQYQEVIAFAQDFQQELITEFQMLEVNEMTKYQQFIAEKAKSAANLKMTYTEKLVRLFKLHEKYGKVAPNLEMFSSPFGWSPEGVHSANTDQVYKPKNIPDPADFFTFGI